MKSVIITFVIAFLVFEFIEHVVFPLIWFIKDRNKRSNSGVTGMIGKAVEMNCSEACRGAVHFFESLTGSRPGTEIPRRSSSDPSCR